MELQQLIAEAWANRDLLKEAKHADAVRAVIEEVDKGRLRVASPVAGGWQVNEWVKQAILLYFGIQPMQTWDVSPFEFYDKMLLKKNYKDLGVRAVPHAVARYGAYLARNVVLMPSYVNIRKDGVKRPERISFKRMAIGIQKRPQKKKRLKG